MPLMLPYPPTGSWFSILGSCKCMRIVASQKPTFHPHPQTGLIGPIGPPRKIGKIFVFFFLIFVGPWKKMHRMAPNGTLQAFFVLIQNLPTFLAERIWILRIFFLILWTPKFPMSRSPDLQISQMSRFPDFQAPPAPDELSDPNLTPLPTHPGIKYVARALAVI